MPSTERLTLLALTAINTLGGKTQAAVSIAYDHWIYQEPGRVSPQFPSYQLRTMGHWQKKSTKIGPPSIATIRDG